jgi:putative drug exporter of the RND superfamily
MTLPGMARVARWSVAHRWLVITGWVLLAVAGGLAAARSGSRLSFTFDLPGRPAYETNTAIARTFGSGGNEPPLVAVVRLPRGVTDDGASPASAAPASWPIEPGHGLWVCLPPGRSGQL